MALIVNSMRSDLLAATGKRSNRTTPPGPEQHRRAGRSGPHPARRRRFDRLVEAKSRQVLRWPLGEIERQDRHDHDWGTRKVRTPPPAKPMEQPKQRRPPHTPTTVASHKRRTPHHRKDFLDADLRARRVRGIPQSPEQLRARREVREADEAVLPLDAVYGQLFDEVWRWLEWPDRGGKVDTGIDLVARERETGEYTAIQCKFYEPTHTCPRATSTRSSPPRARSRSPTG